jgi:hypothetical protein
MKVFDKVRIVSLALYYAIAPSVAEECPSCYVAANVYGLPE